MANNHQKNENHELTQQMLMEVLDYDRTSGVFRWRKKPSRRVNVGDVAGSANNEGYIRIVIEKKSWRAHRLAWLYVYGELPTLHIDHIDGNRANNAIANLRTASVSLNQQNQRTARHTNASGYLGVQKRRDANTWRAIIKIDGKRHDLGAFKTPEEAHQAYLNAKRELHPGCTI